MKTKLLSLLIMLCCIGLYNPTAEAQSIDDKTWFSVYLGHNELNGENVNELGKFNIPRDMGGGFAINRYLSPSFDVNVNTFMTRVDSDYSNSFSRRMFNVSTNLNYKLANDYIFDANSAVQPFIHAGVGFSYFQDGRADRQLDKMNTFQIPFGAGFDVPLSKNVELTFKSTFTKNFSDEIDGLTSNSATDNQFIHTAGVKFRLGRVQDTDNDGIRDSKDECPEVAGDYRTEGCADRDFDAVLDSEDRCPNQAGLAEFAGCPDTDADGVPNYEDKCPTVPGSATMNGCADTDNDGIDNRFDECPTVAGTAATNGCADNDGDAVKNTMDDCPNTAGVVSNNGCPVITAEIEKEVNLIFNNIYFATDSDTLHTSSVDALDKLATILNDDEGLNLMLVGHADSRDTKEYNKELSIDRANAVKAYLVENGIDADRISTKGLGETKPIASNTTDDGKNRNRRVEIKLSYN
ncbi:MAG: OmpA family protein [Balneolaceae bacterium]|nr:OmpA family protein [Balneolaceae bacterium]